MINNLQNSGYGVTSFDAQGVTGPVKVIYTFFHRKELRDVIETIEKHNPATFYTVEEIRASNKGVFHHYKSL